MNTMILNSFIVHFKHPISSRVVYSELKEVVMAKIDVESFHFNHDLKNCVISTPVKGQKNAQLSYELDKREGRKNIMKIKDVYIPPSLQDFDIAEELALRAVQFAEKEGYLLEPETPYMQGYLNKHPEFNYLVPSK